MITLYCLPCAGASAALYMSWRRKLPAAIAVQPVELPGRGSRMGQALLTDFDTLADLLQAQLAPGLAEPYALFGHSMGGLLGFELARRFAKLGRPPAVLLIAACPAPSRRDISRYQGLETDEALIGMLNELAGTPPEIFEHPELLRLTLDTLAADIKVCSSYRHRPGEPLDVPVHVLGGIDDRIGVEALRAWNEETSAGHSLTLFEGGHFFIQSRAYPVLEHLRSLLAPVLQPA